MLRLLWQILILAAAGQYLFILMPHFHQNFNQKIKQGIFHFPETSFWLRTFTGLIPVFGNGGITEEIKVESVIALLNKFKNLGKLDL